MCHHEEFLGLLPAKLVELTSNDNLQVDKEEAVFQAVARWYNHKPEVRRPDFYKVSFSFISLFILNIID